MNTNVKTLANAFTVGILSPDFIMKAMQMYRDKFGDHIVHLTHGLGIGCVMADFHFQINTLEPVKDGKEENLHLVYEKFRTAMFIDQQGNAVPPGFTVGIADRVNKRDIFVAVGLTGDNVVLYQKTPDDTKISKIGIIGDPLTVRALRMQPEWKDGNSHDKVMLSSMFGFEYDRNDDEILVPEGRMESSFALSRKIADRVITSYRQQHE